MLRGITRPTIFNKCQRTEKPDKDSEKIAKILPSHGVLLYNDLVVVESQLVKQEIKSWPIPLPILLPNATRNSWICFAKQPQCIPRQVRLCSPSLPLVF